MINATIIIYVVVISVAILAQYSHRVAAEADDASVVVAGVAGSSLTPSHLL